MWRIVGAEGRLPMTEPKQTEPARERFASRLWRWVVRALAVGLWLLLFLGLFHLVPIRPRVTLRAEKQTKLICFTPDGSTLVTSTAENSLWSNGDHIQVWNLGTGEERYKLDASCLTIDDVQFSPDGKLLAATLDGKHLKLWETATGKEVADLALGSKSGEHGSFRFSPDGRFLLVQRRDVHEPPFWRASVQIWEIETKQVRATIRGTVQGIRNTPDGMIMTVCQPTLTDWTRRISQWRLGDGPQAAVEVRAVTVTADLLAFSPELDTFATGTVTSRHHGVADIKLWDMDTGTVKAVAVYDEPHARLGSLAFSPGGRYLIGRSDWPFRDDQTVLWDAHAQLKVVQTFATPLVFSGDDRRMLNLHDDGADVLEPGASTKRGEIRSAGDKDYPPSYPLRRFWDEPPCTKAVFSPNGETVAITGLYNERKTDVFTSWLAQYVNGTSAGSEYVPVARLWDVQRCKELACFDNCNEVLYAPDGRTLATAHADGTVRLWDVPPRKPLLALLGTSLVLWLSVLVGIRLWGRLVRWWFRARRSA
jgi:WD40 repeat protein